MSGDNRSTAIRGFIDQIAGTQAVLRTPVAITHATAGLNTGVPLYVPRVGEIVTAVWVDITTAFDGTTPLLDVGQFTDAGTDGWIVTAGGTGVDCSAASTIASGGTTGAVIMSDVGAASTPVCLPARCPTEAPILVVVSQDASKGGTAVGGTAGAATVYVETIRPE